MKTTILNLLCILIFSLPLAARTLFLAPDGNDSQGGTFDAPFGSFPKAISAAQPGDTIFVRGGTFSLTTTVSIGASKSGTDSARYFLLAFPGEWPLLDFSAQAFGGKGIRLQASYWYIFGLTVKGAGDNGMEIRGGSFNIIERCTFFENRDTGLQMGHGAANNQVLNCDSYLNADPPDYGDADGFAPKLTVGSGNYFYGCRAWGNCDDGWDGYLRGASDMTTTLENCWTWGNGFLADGSDPGSQANGNGFKMGGGDDGNSARLMHHFILKNCVAFDNKAKGFDQNNNDGSMTLLNCTGYNNRTANYRIKREMNPGQKLMVKNCVSYQGKVELGSFAIQAANSWRAPFLVTADDFLSLDPSLAEAPRQPDGSLPEIDFLHLAPGSDLIDAGVDLGLPFNGTAPDLGAFESKDVSQVYLAVSSPVASFRLAQNYPNPFNSTTVISYRLDSSTLVRLAIFNTSGQLVRTLASGAQPAGPHSVVWDGCDKAGQTVSSGIYLYRLEAGAQVESRKLLLVK